MEPRLSHFFDELADIPWFANLGRPSPRDPEVFRIYDWLTWPGPEDPGAEMLAAYHMKWRDDVFACGEVPDGFDMKRTWDAIQTAALQLTKAHLPYDEAQDAWYGPNAAAWSAAWSAALVGCRRLIGGKSDGSSTRFMQWTPENEWSWYEAGHWPCMYYWPCEHTRIAVAERTSEAKVLVVF
jgi:hypothetical protein